MAEAEMGFEYIVTSRISEMALASTFFGMLDATRVFR